MVTAKEASYMDSIGERHGDKPVWTVEAGFASLRVYKEQCGVWIAGAYHVATDVEGCATTPRAAIADIARRLEARAAEYVEAVERIRKTLERAK